MTSISPQSEPFSEHYSEVTSFTMHMPISAKRQLRRIADKNHRSMANQIVQ